jgi:hypothetical protein
MESIADGSNKVIFGKDRVVLLATVGEFVSLVYGIFNMPGGKYEYTITTQNGNYLSYASPFNNPKVIIMSRLENRFYFKIRYNLRQKDSRRCFRCCLM